MADRWGCTASELLKRIDSAELTEMIALQKQRNWEAEQQAKKQKARGKKGR